MSKNLKRIIAIAMAVGTVSAAAPATSANLLTTKAYASSSDADELSSLEVNDDDGESIDLYSDSDYEDDVDNSDVEADETYYAECSTDTVSIDIDGADDDKVRIFKGSSTTAYEVGDDISLSDGTTTLKVRVYEDDYDEDESYSSSDYNQYTVKVEYNEDDDDDDDENDVDELDSLELLNSNDKTIKLYSDDDYDSDNKVDSEDVEADETYYAKTSSDSVSVDIDGPDEEYVKIFKSTSSSAKGVDPGDDISITGDKTLTVRIYSSEPDSDITYDEDDDVIGEYIIELEYTGDSTSSESSTSSDTTSSTSSNTTSSTSTATNTATSQTNTATQVQTQTVVAIKTGWIQVNGGWQYNDDLGQSLKNQWIFDRNYQKWYYLKNDGIMASNSWIQSGSKWYFLNSDGSMATNTTIGTYKVGSDGAWIS